MRWPGVRELPCEELPANRLGAADAGAGETRGALCCTASGSAHGGSVEGPGAAREQSMPGIREWFAKECGGVVRVESESGSLTLAVPAAPRQATGSLASR